MKKSIPEIREQEGNEKIHSHNSGKGIGGFHSWEWTGTGIPAHPCRTHSFIIDLILIVNIIRIHHLVALSWSAMPAPC